MWVRFFSMQARIYRPTRTAMQSGEAKTKDWTVRFEPKAARRIDPLMGWTSSSDTDQQVTMRFPTREAAVAYCEKHGIEYQVQEPRRRKFKTKSYSDNFRYDAVR